MLLPLDMLSSQLKADGHAKQSYQQALAGRCMSWSLCTSCRAHHHWSMVSHHEQPLKMQWEWAAHRNTAVRVGVPPHEIDGCVVDREQLYEPNACMAY